jgi:hypothetical protein
MNTCGDCPRRPAVAALLAGARKSVRAGLLRWKAPRAREGRRIDVLRRERAHAIGSSVKVARSGVPRPAVHERCQRVRLGEAAVSRKSCGAFSPPRAQARAWQPIGPKPASRRQARGCWRPDDRKVVRRRPRMRSANRRPRSEGRSRGRTSAGFPRRSAGSLQR